MSSGDTATELRFDPPGPGSWELDRRSLPAPGHALLGGDASRAVPARASASSRASTGCSSTAAIRSTSTASRTSTVVPVADEEVPERFQRAEEVFERKLWREQLREWDETVKPASIEAHRELQSVDPDALSDDELAAYLTRCRDHHAEMIYQHMRFTAAAIVPTGDFLAHVGDWTGVAAGRAARPDARRGAGVGGRVRRARAADRRDRAGSARAAAARVGRRPGRGARRRCARSTARPAQPCPRISTWSATGCSTASTSPSRSRSSCPTRCSGRSGSPSKDGRRRDVGRRGAGSPTSAARSPRSTEREFDELLGEARLMYRLRDERGVFSDIWASGIMRRAALAAGRRLADEGRIHEPEHFVDAGLDEMRALRPGADGPSADELARAARVPDVSRSAKDAPRDPRRRRRPRRPTRPACRPASARVMRAIGHRARRAVRQLRGAARGGPAPRARREQGVYEGPARRVAGPSEFDRIVQGDVLVTESTTEAFNILLPLLGAIVTDSGGLLSHSAIVAREYGIPGRRRDARGDRAHRRRRARARRRRRRRGDGARVKAVVPLEKARDDALFGSKAVGLGRGDPRRACRSRPGVALAGRDRRGRRRRRGAAPSSRSPKAVRAARRARSRSARRPSTRTAPRRASPASTSRCSTFRRPTSWHAALREIWWSANSDSAITYRQRVGLFTRPSVGVVVQSLLDPGHRRRDVHAEPVTGADERVIEASWGLGEAVVAGLVIPDHYRVDRSGRGARADAGAQADRDPARCRTAARSRRRCPPSWSSSSASTTSSSRS